MDYVQDCIEQLMFHIPVDGSGTMSPLKSNELTRIFEKIDRDGDGYMSVEELNRFLDRIGICTSLNEVEAIVGQKSLNFQEFLLFYKSIRKQGEGDDEEDGDDDQVESDLVEAFKVFDLNNDGFISCDELQRVLSSLGLWEEKRGGDCRSMICEYDTNSDGLLDFEEFKNMMLLTIP